MNSLFVFSVFLLCFIIDLTSASTCKGCIDVDEHNFEKVLPRFDVTLLKFDASYPYGDAHNAFVNVANDVADNQNIIVGLVGIKFYGDNENQEFSKKYGVSSKESLPVLKLFVQGEDEPFTYSKNMPWTEDGIIKFVRDHTNIYLGLPGCLETFDKLAIKFASSNDKEAILKESEQEVEKLKIEKEKKIANLYIKFMKKVIESGISFVTKETNRLNKIINGKVNEKKKEELSQRINILTSFNSQPIKTEL